MRSGGNRASTTNSTWPEEWTESRLVVARTEGDWRTGVIGFSAVIKTDILNLDTRHGCGTLHTVRITELYTLKKWISW